MTQRIHLPVFSRITIKNFDLYRDPTGASLFDWDFQPGVNALIGVNGLGKSTLINIMFRLLTGPFDLNRRALEGELGQPDIEPVQIADRRLFSRRVADQARDATASLTVQFGEQTVQITRRLSDLTLIGLEIDGAESAVGEDDKDFYQEQLIRLMRVGSFFDALLILRFLIFVFEDRRSLVWDETAQRQLFRATMSSAADATRSLQLQRRIVEADSSARNIRVQANKAQKQLDDAIANLQRRDSSMAQLHLGEETVQGIKERQGDLLSALEDLEGELLQERRSRMKSEHERDQLLRQLDGAKLTLLSTLFGALEPAARLALNRLVEKGRCVCCGKAAPDLQDEINAAIAKGLCPYCKQPVDIPDEVEVVDPATISLLEQQYEMARIQAEASTSRLADLDSQATELRVKIGAAERELNSALTRQNKLRQTLAIEPDDVTQKRYAVDALTSIMDDQLRERKLAEESLVSITAELEADVRNKQDKIADAFARFANAFMRENCSLTYIGRESRVGQEGARFRFPAFQVALSGGAVAGSTLRDNPGSVSLSQREFIDIAFRMALMDVVAPDYGSTLVVDTPEAGLDFLFAERAGSQFLSFSRTSAGVFNRLIVTSNLVSKHLLVAMLADAKTPEEREERMMNLITHAAPTAAVRLDAERYNNFYQELVDGN